MQSSSKTCAAQGSSEAQSGIARSAEGGCSRRTAQGGLRLTALKCTIPMNHPTTTNAPDCVGPSEHTSAIRTGRGPQALVSFSSFSVAAL